MSNVPTTPGCYIDGSHVSSFDLDVAVVRFAHDLGWDGGTWNIARFLSDAARDDMSEDDNRSIWEASGYVADVAVEWLNSNRADEDLYWEIDENSLFLTSIDGLEGM